VSDQFSAAPSALGYFYQCELALLELLRRDDPALELSIELLDDIAFEGEQQELLQAKYQVTPGNLTDGSADLWKTLRVWSEGEAKHPEALLVLITTAQAQPGSIASLLKADGDRDADLAHERLVSYARSVSTDTLEKARSAFLNLGDERRLSMVRRVVVADQAPDIADLEDQFARALRLAAPSDRRAALSARLREWWLVRAERHLLEVAHGSHPRIEFVEVENRIADLRDQLSLDNLPNDFEDLAAPSDEEVESDQRTFVMQLRLISLANARIRLAIHDHNRAFAQRARWLREDLVAIGELARYEQRLKDEWERVWLPETDEPLELEEDEARARGRDVYRTCDEAVVEPIRPKVSAPHIMRGSMQMLADELTIGWHHDWVKRIQELLEEARK
jgi:hypothetical protein